MTRQRTPQGWRLERTITKSHGNQSIKIVYFKSDSSISQRRQSFMVKINGNDCDVSGMTISEYLATTDYDPKIIAVECNEEIVPKAKYDETVIQNGDVIEVVSFVGGG